MQHLLTWHQLPGGAIIKPAIMILSQRTPPVPVLSPDCRYPAERHALRRRI